MAEISGHHYAGVPTEFSLSLTANQNDLEQLLALSGFPEPLYKGEKRFAGRWRLQYGHLLLREDLRTLEAVKDMEKIETLFAQLATTVGSVLSINALREDLEVAFATAKNWLQIFERLYATFRIAPYGPPSIRAVKKEQKLYFWDWTRGQTEAGQMENLVAVHLLRWVDWMQDVEGIPAELRFFRTPQGHEVDFIILKNHQPWMAIEVKSTDRPLDSGLQYLVERLHIPYAFQLSFRGNQHHHFPQVGKNGVTLVNARSFLANLP